MAKYDVAISFAGEDRGIAESIAKGLTRIGLTVFYDDYEKGSLWGKDLYSHLTAVYRDDAKFCLMLVSEHYARKQWTGLERKAAQARAFKENREYILPLRIDDTDIEGVLETTGYVDYRSTTPEQIIDLLMEKVISFNKEQGIEFEPIKVEEVFSRAGVGPKGETIRDTDMSTSCPTCKLNQKVSDMTMQLDGADTTYLCRKGCQRVIVVSRPGASPWHGRGFRLGDFTIRNASELILRTEKMGADLMFPASEAALTKRELAEQHPAEPSPEPESSS